LTRWLLISELMIDTQFLEERVPFTLHNQKVRHCTGFKLSFVWYTDTPAASHWRQRVNDIGSILCKLSQMVQRSRAATRIWCIIKPENRHSYTYACI